MKKHLFILFILLSTTLFAQKVSYNSIRNTAINWLKNQNRECEIEPLRLHSKQDQAACYIFQLKPKGFVIVSCDRRAWPILAHSFENNFRKDTLNKAIEAILNGYADDILFAKNNNLPIDKSTNREWKKFDKKPSEFVVDSLTQRKTKTITVGPFAFNHMGTGFTV